MCADVMLYTCVYLCIVALPEVTMTLYVTGIYRYIQVHRYTVPSDIPVYVQVHVYSQLVYV